ncbi:MAG: cytochrome c [Gammaproteobacteria bacterium]|nr:cytochrome c [Gammaproteobacteria bacterium]
MKRGEWGIVIGIGVVVVAGMAWKSFQTTQSDKKDFKIPFYSTASPDLQARAAELMRRENCRQCHTLWSTRDPLQAVPAPPLDGMGSLKDEAWLYTYLSAPRPQDIVPTRLKPEYRHPSLAYLPDAERRSLAQYLASLKVEDWYLAEVKKVEFEKLTGKDYVP